MFSPILQRLMDKSPVPVMAQILLERVLCPKKLDDIFNRAAVKQYTRTLLFSTVFELMNLVIFKTYPFVNAADKEEKEKVGVSITALYNKLNGISAIEHFYSKTGQQRSAIAFHCLNHWGDFLARVANPFGGCAGFKGI